MRKDELFHPRVFEDEQWAAGYYKRNAKNIRRMGLRLCDVLEKSGFQEGKILDAGCGFGTIAIEIAGRFPKVEITGVDLSEPLLTIAENQVCEKNVDGRVRFLKEDVQDLTFDDDAFDVVISSFMLHIVENPVRMLNEVKRVAKPQARILITDLRRIWLGCLVKKIRTSYTLPEAVNVIEKSELQKGVPAKGPFWWDYFIGLNNN